MTKGTDLIAAERERQISVEGYTAAHDATIGAEQLTDAAITYALASEAPSNAEAITVVPGDPDARALMDMIAQRAEDDAETGADGGEL